MLGIGQACAEIKHSLDVGIVFIGACYFPPQVNIIHTQKYIAG
jgi:hypothetical protein